MKMFEIFDLKMLVGRFQNALTFFIINRFGRDFFQSCVDFHGGGDRRGFRANGASRVALPKNIHSPAKKNLLY